MPIIFSRIVKARNRGNGRLAVFEQHTDDKGTVHEHRYSCPEKYDIDQALLDWRPKLEATLINIEEEKIKNAQWETIKSEKLKEAEVLFSALTKAKI